MLWQEIITRSAEVLSMGEPNTAKTYVNVLKLFDDKPTQLSFVDKVREWRNEVDANTILIRFAALRWVFKHFYREFDSDEVNDILLLMRGVKRLDKKMAFATGKAVSKILARAYDEGRFREGLAIAMMYYGGMRVSEVVSTKVAQFRDTVFIANSKNNTQREVPVHPIMRKFFDLYMAERDLLGTDSEYVFVTCQGDMKCNTLQKTVKALCKKAGYPKLHCHSFRHGCATTLANAGVSEFTIKEYMGHKSMNTTAKYVHISKAQLQSAQAVMI